MRVRNVTFDGIPDDMVNTVVRQLGATSIKTTAAHVNIATFTLSENIKLKYKYDLKASDTYYLQRVSPYPTAIGACENTEQLIAMLKKDLKMFENAFTSSNFPEFLSIMDKLTEAVHRTEDLFLHYNVQPDDLTDIDEHLLSIFHKLRDARRHAEYIGEPAPEETADVNALGHSDREEVADANASGGPNAAAGNPDTVAERIKNGENGTGNDA